MKLYAGLDVSQATSICIIRQWLCVRRLRLLRVLVLMLALFVLVESRSLAEAPQPSVASLAVSPLSPDRERALQPKDTFTGVVTLSEIGPIWTINQQAKSLKSLASTSAIVGKFRSV